MEQYNIRHTKSALRDLDGILQYISIELEAPETALKMIETIEHSIGNLSYMPHRCALVDDERLAAMGYRKLIIKNYIAFFTIEELTLTINIERILYARRDWLNIL